MSTGKDPAINGCIGVVVGMVLAVVASFIVCPVRGFFVESRWGRRKIGGAVRICDVATSRIPAWTPTRSTLRHRGKILRLTSSLYRRFVRWPACCSPRNAPDVAGVRDVPQRATCCGLGRFPPCSVRRDNGSIDLGPATCRSGNVGRRCRGSDDSLGNPGSCGCCGWRNCGRHRRRRHGTHQRQEVRRPSRGWPLTLPPNTD